jgi:hypothetical protein
MARPRSLRPPLRRMEGKPLEGLREGLVELGLLAA